MTRRELIAAFLGLPCLALAGCSRSARSDAFGGEIVGTADVVGHRLRDGYSVRVPEDKRRPVDVVIIGGGIAGLAVAHRLHQARVDDFLVLELEPAPGGTSRFGESDVVDFPWGAHYVPAPTSANPLLVSLFDEMGVLEGRDRDGEPIVAEQYLCRDPQERLFMRGRWYEGIYPHAGESREDVEQLARFQREIDHWVAWRDGKDRRAFTLPIAHCSDDADAVALDRISMADWLDQKGFTSDRLRWLIDYHCRDDYGTTLQDTSAWAGLFYSAARQSRPGAAPEPLITWPEGNGRIVRHLLRSTKGRLRTGTAVVEVHPRREGGVDVTAFDAQTNEPLGYRARHAVFAVPQFMRRYMIPGARQDPRWGQFDHGAWMVANVFLKGRPSSHGFPLAWDSVFYQSPSLGYVAATHQACKDHGPTVFTYYYPLCDSPPKSARERLLNHGWRDWTDIVVAELRRGHPGIEPLIERIDVMRWGHAMVRPRPGFLWSATRLEAATPLGDLHFAHTDLSGMGLFEEAYYHGLRAAEEILTKRRA